MDADRYPRYRSGPLLSTIAGSSWHPRNNGGHPFGPSAATSPAPPLPLKPSSGAIFDGSDGVEEIVRTSLSPAQKFSQPVWLTSFAVMALFVVASLCAVVGAIYLLIYFKSIKPMSARSRSYKDSGGGAKGDEDGSRSKSAHPFFRHK